MKPDIVVHGIRFYWDCDSGAYVAQVSIDDIQEVYADGAEAMREVLTFRSNDGWEDGVVDRQSGAFTQDEIDDATAWK